jgi:predicted DsbA family dithiol-disulfide isomerase
MFAAAGLPYKRDNERVPNTSKALRLTDLAVERGVAREFHDRLQHAFWAEGADLVDDAVLLDHAEAVGLDRAEAEAALGDPERAAHVREYTVAAIDMGAGGVPAWLLDERLLIPGAQPHEVFDRVLARLGYEPVAD